MCDRDQVYASSGASVEMSDDMGLVCFELSVPVMVRDDRSSESGWDKVRHP